jgi:hypothetical protein
MAAASHGRIAVLELDEKDRLPVLLDVMHQATKAKLNGGGHAGLPGARRLHLLSYRELTTAIRKRMKASPNTMTPPASAPSQLVHRRILQSLAAQILAATSPTCLWIGGCWEATSHSRCVPHESTSTAHQAYLRARLQIEVVFAHSLAA